VRDADDEDDQAAALRNVLLAGREAGFLGPGAIEQHLRHAEGFVALTRTGPEAETARLLDLGSGSGLPGLVVAIHRPEVVMVLLEANARRAQFLSRSIVTCGLQGRVSVVQERAEICGRNALYRGTFDAVVVRSFGPPALVAECSAPFLRAGGSLIVSEPPESEGTGLRNGNQGRWPAEQLARFGLEPVELVRHDFGYQVLRQYAVCPDTFPRRNGIPAKRPLF
jgi:16S rRNA (guanine527-N7)-methyltransferase